jgi:isopenicillin N synthase-like dioxygenase
MKSINGRRTEFSLGIGTRHVSRRACSIYVFAFACACRIGNIGLELMRAVARAFALEPHYFDQLMDDRSLAGAGTLSTFRLNFYPTRDDPCPVSISDDDQQALSCEEHCDGSVFTILYQHEIGGLQVKMSDGHWLDVPVVPYSLVVNVGKCLERWTNGRLTAVRHRVKLLDDERISIPFFVEPSYSTLIVPLTAAGDKMQYEPITYGRYITESNKQFKEYQRDEIAGAIEH